MVSASIPLSTPFLTKSTLTPPLPPPSSVKFRISASHGGAATAERITISNSQSSLYEVLGVQMGSSSQEIKSAYRRLARVVHPDVASNGARNDTSAADEFIRIHAAYSTLSDPGKRADYDRTLFQRRSPVATSSFSGYTSGRSWETDQCW
ncbi:hypothetical protein Vadar_018361 [Vaccinium darrowii]|uniref:Uncharacterized protein n=1 Tax=Vaccinium darrowii TaxID=229202 RepID=A0ACB7XZY5_9ERIC|nr:hypothetical protein Vadar_018361 [Vaccinium darrowii]